MRPSRRFSIVTIVGFIALIAGMVLFINSNIQEGSSFNFSQMVLVVGLAVFVISIALYFGALITDRYYRNYDPRVKEAFEDEKLVKNLDDRSLQFLGTPIITLYYANSEEIDNIYSTYFGEDIVIAITSETSEEAGGEINAIFPKILGVKQVGKDITKIIKNYKPKEETTLGKFLRYQRVVILRRQVNLGLELVRMDFQEINDFDNTIDWLVNTHKLDLSKSANELNDKRGELFTKAAEETLALLEGAKDLVLMEEKFLISENDANFICTYLHPVSQYIYYQGIEVKISFSIPKGDIQKSKFDFAQVIGKVIPLRVFGKVLLPLDRMTNNWEMLIKPIGVY